MADKVRLAIRGFVNRVMQFEDLVEVDESRLDEVLPRLAEKHAEELASNGLHMIEIEFLDEPDVQERFMRFGTDPSGMIRPLQIELGRPD